MFNNQFCALLKSNGIKLPRTKWGQTFFVRKWSETYAQYCTYVAHMEDIQRAADKLCEDLREFWPSANFSYIGEFMVEDTFSVFRPSPMVVQADLYHWTNAAYKKLAALKAKWEIAKVACAEYRKTLEHYNKCVVYEREKLSESWPSKNFSDFGRILSEPVWSFVSPEEAAQFFKNKEKEVQNIQMTLRESSYLADKSARMEWVKKLRKSIPQKCELVVIKEHYSPSAESKESFNACVQQKHECAILMLFSPVWLAIRKNEFESAEIAELTKHWVFSENNCEVEFH